MPGGSIDDGIKAVSYDDIASHGQAYSRISESLTTAFIQKKIQLAELDPSKFDRSKQQLRVVLTNYIKAKSLPLKVFETGGKLYLERTDWEDLVMAEGKTEVPQPTLKQV